MPGHKVKEEYPVRLELEGALLKRFEVLKKYYGLEDDDEVMRVLLYEKYKQLFPKEAAFFEQFCEKANLEKLGWRSMKKQVKDAKKPEIEYIHLHLEFPKACLEYLNENVKNPDVWLENSLIEKVRAEYENRSLGTWAADEIELSPVFWQLLKDKRYHPNLDIREAAIEEPTA